MAPRKSGRTGRRKIRFAVVGLGWFAQVAVLPAFRHASRNAELTALFSDEPEKLRKLGRKYGVCALHSYEEFDQVLASGQIDAVYLTLPNHLHREYTIRAAKAGVHVLCEKPMAVTEEDCEAMIRATESAGVLLMIAYRLHFERANLEAVEIVRSGKLGEPRFYHSVLSNPVTDPENIRLSPIEKGGGTLYDIGIYCINASRYIFRSEPTEVMARSANNGEKRFRDVDEMTSAILNFPDERLAVFTSSFGAAPSTYFEVFGTKGWLRVEGAFEFAEGMKHRLTIGDRTREKKFEKRDEVAPEILYFSDCIRKGKTPEPSGREGLADVRIIRALYRSAQSGRPVELSGFAKKRRPTLRQEIHRPPVGHQELVSVEEPSAN
jgi:predicted dehydrogenase